MNKRLISTESDRPLSSVFCLLLVASTYAMADTELQPFTDLSLDDWQQRSFVGHTQYQLTTDNGTRVLKGSANAKASLLYKQLDISLVDTPMLSWHWKIDNVFTDTNEQTRDGDDFPARVYVVYRYGRFAWQTYAINYVWASHTPKDDSWNSPYTNKSKLIAVQSGNTLAGQWQFETRNVADDFATLFNVEVGSLAGIAVMVDADNTGKSAVAHFGAIQFNREQ
ncbi:MAG: DUF3047 domain-containing protein [Granulosicoccaceae bacterium]